MSKSVYNSKILLFHWDSDFEVDYDWVIVFTAWGKKETAVQNAAIYPKIANSIIAV